MEQKTLIAVIRKWWIVLLAVAIAGGVVARVVASFIEPTYESTVRLLTGPTAADLNTLEASGALARTYSELATSQPQLQAVASELGLVLTPDQLAEDVNATSNDVTRVVAIRVRQPTAEGAQTFATRLGERMVALSTEGAQRDAELAAELLRQDAFAGFSEVQRRTFRDAASTVLGTQRVPGTLSVVDPARVATSPVSPRIPLLVLLGALCGLALGGAVVVARERKSGTVDDAPSLAGAVGAPVLGTLGGGDMRSDLVLQSAPDSSATVQVRRLADQISYLARDGVVKSIAVLDAEHGGPGGAIAANLATALAAPDLRVMVVDADPDRADVTRLFRLSSHSGLSDFVRGDDGGRGDPDVLGVVRGTGLTVIPAGAPDGAHRRLDPRRVREIVQSLESECEIVLIAPPALERSSDALVWAEQTDGTLIVAEQGATATDSVIRVGDDVRAVSARIIGTVFVGARTIPGLGRLSGRRLRGTGFASRQLRRIPSPATSEAEPQSAAKGTAGPGGALRVEPPLVHEDPVVDASVREQPPRPVVPERVEPRDDDIAHELGVDEAPAFAPPRDEAPVPEQPVDEMRFRDETPNDATAGDEASAVQDPTLSTPAMDDTERRLAGGTLRNEHRVDGGREGQPDSGDLPPSGQPVDGAPARDLPDGDVRGQKNAAGMTAETVPAYKPPVDETPVGDPPRPVEPATEYPFGEMPKARPVTHPPQTKPVRKTPAKSRTHPSSPARDGDGE